MCIHRYPRSPLYRAPQVRLFTHTPLIYPHSPLHRAPQHWAYHGRLWAAVDAAAKVTYV